MERYVFLGDSHTCGLEIEDHLVLDNDFEMVNVMKEGLIDQHAFSIAVVMWHMHMAKTTKMTPWDFVNRDIVTSYPHLLSDLHDVEIKKYCQTASSMDYILLQIENLHSTGEITPEQDTLFIGMCRPTRMFALDSNEGKYNFDFENIQTEGKASNDPETAHLLKRIGQDKTILLAEFLTDYTLVARFYSALSGIMNFAELHGYKLHLIPHFSQEYIKVDSKNRPKPAWDFKAYCNTKQEWMYNDFCINTYNRAVLYMVSETHTLTYFQYDREPCGFYHPDAQAHKLFAEYLANNLDKARFN